MGTLVKTGRLTSFMLSCAGLLSLAVPAYAAEKRSLEAEFDSFFKVSKAISAKSAVSAAAKPKTTAAVPLVALEPVRPAFTKPATASPAYTNSLEASVAALADASRGRIGVAAIDLQTGRSVSVLGDQPFPLASTSKIAIVATFLAGVDEGKYKLYDQYPLMVPVPSKRFSSAVAPVRPGMKMSALSLIEAAITRSDNHATDALLAAVGGPAVVTRWVRENTGITEFRLDRDIATLVRDDGAVNPALSIDRRDSVTPMAMVRLLTGLKEGRWLSPQSNQVLLGAMSRTVTGRHRMKSLLPEGTSVAHKTGTLNNVASDVGFIRTAEGRELAVAIYVTGQGGKPQRDARIAQLARAIYDGYLAESSGQRRAALR